MPDCIEVPATFGTGAGCCKSGPLNEKHFVFQGCLRGAGSPLGSLGPLGDLGHFASWAQGTRVPNKWASPVSALLRGGGPSLAPSSPTPRSSEQFSIKIRRTNRQRNNHNSRVNHCHLGPSLARAGSGWEQVASPPWIC